MKSAWKLLCATASMEQRESVVGFLFAHQCQGLEEIDQTENQVLLKAYFHQDSPVHNLISTLEQADCSHIRVSEIPDTDYEKKWRKSLTPVRLSNHFWIKPSWAAFEPPPGQDVLVIDPKMSFGTGHHATTQICAQFMDQIGSLQARAVLDAGTGTGIFAILACKLGAQTVVAFDIDPVIRENALENFERNRAAKINLFIGNAQSLRKPGQFDLIVTNMIREKLFQTMDALMPLLHPNGRFICSGILDTEIDAAKAFLKNKNLELQNEMRKDEWWGVICVNQPTNPP